MCRWRGDGAEKAWRTRRLAAGAGRVIEWWQAGWEDQNPLAAVAAGFCSPEGNEEMRVRTGALAVLVAAVARIAFCAGTASLAASASVGDGAGAWAAPGRMAAPKGAERR